MRGKKAAIEMSIGTIVVIVLAMSMLILGMVLVKNIFGGATDIATMTTDQVKNQVAQMFGDQKDLVIYPDTRHIEVEVGEVSGFGLGIKNVDGLTGGKFSYEVIVSDPDIQSKCGVSESEALGWITTGRAEKDINLAPGDFTSGKVLLSVPVGTNFCTFRYRINVMFNNAGVASEFVDVTIKA
jgi:hypothetical protein